MRIQTIAISLTLVTTGLLVMVPAQAATGSPRPHLAADPPHPDNMRATGSPRPYANTSPRPDANTSPRPHANTSPKPIADNPAGQRGDMSGTGSPRPHATVSPAPHPDTDDRSGDRR